MSPERHTTAGEIAELVGGRLVGDHAVSVTGVAPLARAGSGDLGFLTSSRYLESFRRSHAAVVLIRPEFEDEPDGPATRIVVDDPHHALSIFVPTLYPEPETSPQVHSTAVLGERSTWGDAVDIGPHVVLGRAVRLGDRVRLGPGCIIGDDVEIGDDTRLFPRVTVYSSSRIGARVTLHAGVVVGSDGFGFATNNEGSHRKLLHIGRVIIEDDVEIGANSTIDRGSIDDTIIGAGSKLDNLVHVGHNTHVGRRCLLAGASAIAGSAELGDDVVLAGQAGVGPHCRVGARAQIGAQAGVIKDLAAGGRYAGMPARPLQRWLRATAAAYRVGEMLDDLEDAIAPHDPPS